MKRQAKEGCPFAGDSQAFARDRSHHEGRKGSTVKAREGHKEGHQRWTTEYRIDLNLIAGDELLGFCC